MSRFKEICERHDTYQNWIDGGTEPSHAEVMQRDREWLIKRIEELEAQQWQPIETAPKGVGAGLVTDPDFDGGDYGAYVKPPDILLYFPAENIMEVGSWDWYYAEGGNGYEGCSAWCCSAYEPAAMAFDEPTHWMSLPEAPQEQKDES